MPESPVDPVNRERLEYLMSLLEPASDETIVVNLILYLSVAGRRGICGEEVWNRLLKELNVWKEKHKKVAQAANN